MIKKLVPSARMAAFRFGPVAALFFLASCGDSAEPPRATNLSISPTSVALSYVGETSTVVATVTDQRRQRFEGTVSWSSSDPAVFAVDGAGVVTAVANGTGTLRASIAGLSAEAMVTVRQAADSVAVVSGSGQRGVHGTALPDSVVVRVLDRGGTAVASATVEFVPGGGGSTDPSSAQTDAAGRAATAWTLGPAAGAQSLAVRVPDGPSAEASATALTPAEVADSVEVVSGATRRAAPGHTLAVSVRVLDENGRPVPGAPVTFAPGQGHGTASPASVATGEDGLAATDWTVGGGSEPQTLEASVEGGPASATTATVAAPGAVRATLADPQGATGRPMLVSAQLVDAGGAPLEGSLRFEPAQGHGTVDAGDGPASSAAADTDTTGTGAVMWTPMGDVAGQPTQTVSVSADGFPGVPALEIDLRIASGICYRTPQVVEDLLFKLTPVPSEPKHCADVTLDDLDSSQVMGVFIMPESGITSLKSWDFAGVDVTVMILTGNQLTELPRGVFAGLPNLFPGLPNLSFLALTRNRLTASAFAEVRSLSGLVVLDMGSNPLSEIPEGAFDNFANLEVLGLVDANLRAVPANAFRNLSKLRVLSLARNGGLRTLETGMFRGLSALHDLDLSRTGVETIEAGAFNGLGTLQILDIGNTPDLTTLPAGAFRGLSSLAGFTLDSTAVSAIEPGAFDGLDSLRFLLLERTRLAAWAEGAFGGMPRLEFLWLRDNPRLTALRANSFVGLARTPRNLAVTEGALATVEPGAFDGLTGLQGLLLDGNRLASWPAGALRGPSALAALSLARNGIRAVPGSAFADQPGLSFLNLAGNAISVWPKSALEMLTSLAGLDLSGNDVAELPRDAFAGLVGSLERLDLRGNPGAPFVLGLQLDRAGSGALSEGDQARVLAKTASDVPAYFATQLDWTAAGDVVGLAKGRANMAAGALATDAWTLSGDNNGAAGGATVAVTAVAEFESDSIFGLALQLADTLVLEFAADSTRTNRRPVITDSIPPVSLAPGEAGEPDTATVNVSAYFSDPDGDSLVYEAVPARRIVAASIEGDSLTLVSLLPGRTSVEVRAFDPDGFVAVLDLAVTVRGAFDMEVVYVGDISDEHKEIFEDAAERWESIFVESLPDVDFSESAYDAGQCTEGQPAIADTIADVRIFAAVRPIDGERNILARAGPCALRTDGFLPVLGVMEFDEADIPFLANQPGGLSSTILHEMAHVLGFGTIWGERYANLLRNSSADEGDGADTHFVGELAIGAFDAAGGANYAGGEKVPVDNTGRPGSADGHWRESVLVSEVMTSEYDVGQNPLSAITIQSMADLGYVVDVSQADDYTLPGAGARALADRRCAAGQCIDLSNDIRRGPVVLVDSGGRITGVIRR